MIINDNINNNENVKEMRKYKKTTFMITINEMNIDGDGDMDWCSQKQIK